MTLKALREFDFPIRFSSGVVVIVFALLLVLPRIPGTLYVVF